MADRCARFLFGAVLFAAGLFLIIPLACSFFLTCRVDASVQSETVRLLAARPAPCLFGLAAFLTLALAAARLLRASGRVRALFALAWGLAALFFVLGAGTLQRYDFESVLEAARLFSRGNYKMMRAPYLNAVPYQLGFILPMEVFARLFPFLPLGPAMQALNVAACLTVSALLCRLSARLYGGDGGGAAAACCLLCLPAALQCTFVYGTLPMLALEAAAALCFLRVCRGEKAPAPACALLCGAACMIKPNAYIFLVALAVCCALLALQRRRPSLLLLPALSLALALLLSRGAVFQYELRAGVRLYSRVSAKARLTMGLQDGPAAGWYNLYIERFFPPEVTREEADAEVSRDLGARLSELADSPGEARRFFSEKLLTQWLDPTYGGVRYAQVCPHDGPFWPLFRPLFEDGRAAHAVLLALAKAWQQGVLLLAALGLFAALRGGASAERALLPLTALGGALYHMLFEAKSQYIFVYMILLLPCAAGGLLFLRSCLRRALSGRKRAAGLLLLAIVLPFGGKAERLLVLSDLHLTADAGASAEAEAAILQKAAGCDAALLLGDLANSGRPEEHRRVRGLLRRLGEVCPEVFVLPGNHDLSGGFSPGDFAAYYAGFGYDRAFSRDPSSAGYAVYTGGGLCLLMLDVNGYDAKSGAALHGRVPEGTLDWLRALLSALPTGTRAVACGHYPILPFTGSGNDETAGAEALCRLLEEAGVPLYLCGHRHSNYTLHTARLRQIAVGVPFSWPAWAGLLTTESGGYGYRVSPLFRDDEPAALRMKAEQQALARRMAEGSLSGTAYEGDSGAAEWFVRVFNASLSGTLPDTRRALLEDENCEKWRRAEVRSAAKGWILSLLEQPQEDVRRVFVPLPGP